MRLLDELVRDRGLEWDEVIIELLAGQVIAYAAYHQIRLDDDVLIERTAYSVSGYPLIFNPRPHDKPGMADRLVSRVRAIVNAKVEP